MSSYREFLILRYKAIFRNVGNITIGLSLLILAISFFALINDGNKLFFSFFIPAILTFLTGLFFRIISRGERKKELSIHDATVTVFLVWSLAIFLSSLPFIFANYLNFTQAIFESTSGWTGTGLSMFLDVEILPKSILLWRSVTQYVGGAGFAIITVIIAGSVGAGIYQAEGRSDNLVPNLRESAKIILRIYIIWAIIGTILLMTIGKLPFFDSFNHTLTALATGGFSTKNLSIGAYNSLSVEIIIMILMIMGATGFGIHYAAILMVKNFFRYRKELKKGVLTKLEFKEKIRSEPFLKNPEPRLMFVILLIFSTLLFLFSLLQMYGIKEGIINSIFQSISSLTGTGFSTVSFINWNSFG
ncbi:MAG: potassium transporter TrkG, partial [Defluviitoga tunisiensis]